ncbi:MAG: adenine-specific methyltransferase EcoRI family protein [Christensenellaceae bacterium]|jgi:hypothetical protein|nr:adenine-specific methyltransferase EcoRI family protein [Christensenellaceae bacterium]
MARKTFDNAKKAKNDEFYTQLADIENEMRHYRNQFRGKVVFCNCDDPYESNFFKYFAMNFKFLELKKLIATCYIGSPIANKELSLFPHESVENKTTKAPHKIVINEAIDENKDGAFDLQDIVTSLTNNKKNTLTRLNSDGDFRSAECVALLKEADIVVTNPPFSLFREYVGQLVDNKKDFIIVGNINAITYKDIFQLIKENKLWLGNTHRNRGLGMFFDIPESVNTETATRLKDGKIFIGGAVWFTTLDTPINHQKMTFYKNYKGNESEYIKYDNYDAIEISKTKNIPDDYYGAMGVPITFLNSGYNQEQFEILGFTHRNDPYKLKTKIYTKNDAENFNDLNGSPIIRSGDDVRFAYMRIIIKRKRETRNGNKKL